MQFTALPDNSKNAYFPENKKAIYPHDFSYFAPYGFEDYLLNEHDPLIERCGKEYCEQLFDINRDQQGVVIGDKLDQQAINTFILMKKEISTMHPTELNVFLSSIKLINNNGILINNLVLCEQFNCINNNNLFCRQKQVNFMNSYQKPLPLPPAPPVPRFPPQSPPSQNPLNPTLNQQQLFQQNSRISINP